MGRHWQIDGLDKVDYSRKSLVMCRDGYVGKCYVLEFNDEVIAKVGSSRKIVCSVSGD